MNLIKSNFVVIVQLFSQKWILSKWILLFRLRTSTRDEMSTKTKIYLLILE